MLEIIIMLTDFSDFSFLSFFLSPSFPDFGPIEKALEGKYYLESGQIEVIK